MTKRRGRFDRREWFVLALVVVAVLVLMQLLPVGAAVTNPPTVAEPSWDSPVTRDLFQRACGDCHSNGTEWPWYANVAPASWLVRHDVAEGREHLNVSEWDRQQKDARKAAEQVRDGEMPLALYRVAHSEARLTADEKAQLIAGLAATFGDGLQSATDDDADGGGQAAADSDDGDTDLDGGAADAAPDAGTASANDGSDAADGGPDDDNPPPNDGAHHGV
jgi:hypothetical protein